MKTIEERAKEATAKYECQDGEYCQYYFTDGYIKGATEQQEIDKLHMLLLADACECDKALLIDKACEWMQNHIDKGLVVYHNNTWCGLDEFIGKFRKAMKGE